MKKNKKAQKNNKKTNEISLIVVFLSILAIAIVILICLVAVIRKNKKVQVEDQSIINEDTDKGEIVFIDSVILSYGMDGGNVVEIPLSIETSKLVAISNNEEIARVSVLNNKLRIEATCEDIAETTISLIYNEIEEEIKVYVKPSCLVEFYTDGGTSVIPQMVVYEGNVIRPENPIKEGYEFIGWYVDEGLEEEYNFDAGVYSDMTLYAKYQEI